MAVFIVVFVTAFNDWSKERQFRGLQDKLESEHRLSIIRAGETIDVPVQDILVGDVCFIRYGEYSSVEVVSKSPSSSIDKLTLLASSALKALIKPPVGPIQILHHGMCML